MKLKSYLDYGTFQPIQIAATVTMNEESELSRAGARDLRVTPQRALRRARAHRLGRAPPARVDVRVGADPRAYAELGSLGFASSLIRECEVAVSPGNGFGPGGEGFVRFALIENEQRIGQAVRSLRRGLDRLPSWFASVRGRETRDPLASPATRSHREGSSVQLWDVLAADATGRTDPRVLFSTPEARMVMIDLAAGERLGEHEVHERAIIQVARGSVELTSGAARRSAARARSSCSSRASATAVRAPEHARILLTLAPWPGAGHYDPSEAQARIRTACGQRDRAGAA